MKKLFLLSALLMFACSSDEGNIEDGDNLLLIGNSFFRPYAENLEIVASDAGYQNQNSTLVFRGGENGTAEINSNILTFYSNYDGDNWETKLTKD